MRLFTFWEQLLQDDRYAVRMMAASDLISRADRTGNTKLISAASTCHISPKPLFCRSSFHRGSDKATRMHEGQTRRWPIPESVRPLQPASAGGTAARNTHKTSA